MSARNLRQALFTLQHLAGMPGPYRRTTSRGAFSAGSSLINRYAMLLAQNCLDVGGLTSCNLILICLYGFGVGSLTLIGGSLLACGGNYGGYSGVSLSLSGLASGDDSQESASAFAWAALAAFKIAALSASAFAFAFLA